MPSIPIYWIDAEKTVTVSNSENSWGSLDVPSQTPLLAFPPPDSYYLSVQGYVRIITHACASLRHQPTCSTILRCDRSGPFLDQESHPSDLGRYLLVSCSRTARLRCRRGAQMSETVGMARLLDFEGFRRHFSSSLLRHQVRIFAMRFALICLFKISLTLIP